MSYIGQPLVNSDYMMWSFVGDGSDMTFTLSNFPVSERSVDPKDLLVQIEGILQTPSVGYGFDNTTQVLTFTSPPPLSTNIVVRMNVIL
jgi:hypothetical protein